MSPTVESAAKPVQKENTARVESVSIAVPQVPSAAAAVVQEATNVATTNASLSKAMNVTAESAG